VEPARGRAAAGTASTINTEEIVSKQQRTRINDIALIGAELSEDEMRLAAGGDEVIEIGDCRIVFLFTDAKGGRYDGFVTNDN
jgi:hypothetical protein